MAGQRRDVSESTKSRSASVENLHLGVFASGHQERSSREVEVLDGVDLQRVDRSSQDFRAQERRHRQAEIKK